MIETRRCAQFQNTLETIRSIARERGGECLSASYEYSGQKLRFRCSEGHEWEAVPANIKSGTWCDQCSKSHFISEQLVRLILEEIFGKSFPKKRPKWLRGSRGALLELDGFNEELGMAFEYQGSQHYTEQKFFHRHRPDSFQRQQQRDKEKRNIVSIAGVTLIEIPYFKDNITTKEAAQHIKAVLLQNRIKFDDQKEINPDLVALYSRGLKAKVEKIVKEREGRLHSEGVISSVIKVRVECKNGHKWNVTPSKLENGRWCAKCAKVKAANDLRHSLEFLQAKAVECGGYLKSTESKGFHVKHEWVCPQHGGFWTTPREVIHGNHWCKKCGIKKNKKIKMDNTFKKMKMISIEKGGECLSTSYEYSGKKLRFRCSEGHEWEAISESITQGTWCPKCAHKRGGFAAPGAKRTGFVVLNDGRPKGCETRRNKTLSKVRAHALEKAGKCLSESYDFAKQKLRFRCSEGHEWEATPDKITQGSWCPKCGKKRGGFAAQGTKRPESGFAVNKSAAEKATQTRRNKTLSQVRAKALERGGECLSASYDIAKQKLRFRCSEGHEWEAVPASIKHGTWCPECAHKRTSKVENL